jgi:hypothetical protein
MRRLAAMVVPALLCVPLVLLGLAVTLRDLWRSRRR